MRITMKNLEGLVNNLQKDFPGVELELHAYGEGKTNYCLMKKINKSGGVSQVTNWLPAGVMWEVLRGMQTAAYMCQNAEVPA